MSISIHINLKLAFIQPIVSAVIFLVVILLKDWTKVFTALLSLSRWQEIADHYLGWTCEDTVDWLKMHQVVMHNAHNALDLTVHRLGRLRFMQNPSQHIMHKILGDLCILRSNVPVISLSFHECLSQKEVLRCLFCSRLAHLTV